MSEKYLEYIKEEYIEEGDYGGFYEEVKTSTNVSDRGALQMLRKLKEGEVDESLEDLESLLVSDDG